jgi:4-amino-4-deoxy-L-arabinose transferase-like glycosyltransferase
VRRLRIPLTLTLIVLAALTLYTWNIGYSGLSTYYASGAKSMSESWRALFFGGLNPSATTTLDKLSGFLVPQALSARIFGFSAWALSLPQAVEGAITVIASYAIGTRWRGSAFGLALAALMTFTPMLAAMFGRPMEDGMLTMCMVLSFAAAQRAILNGHGTWMLVSLAWVAVGFQAKMLQAWLILPALAILWWAGRAASRRFRLVGLAAGGGILVVLSLGWMTAIQLVPAASRPFIDGTTNDNMFSMVFGYNGVDRILPGFVPGALPQLDSAAAHAVNGTATSIAGHSPFKLLMPEFTTQIGWLLPLALAGLVLELAVLIRRRAEGPPGAAAIPLGLVLWLIVPALVLSVAFVPHATYFAELALPACALALAGAVRLIRHYRDATGRRWMLLPAIIIVQTSWTIATALAAPASLRFVVVPVAVLGFGGALVLCGLRVFGSPLRRRFTAALAASAVAAVFAPVVWSVCVLGPGGGGSASDAFAGPRIGSSASVVAKAGQNQDGPGVTVVKHPSLRPPFQVPPAPSLDSQQERLLAYLAPRRGDARWLFATDSMPVAVTFLLETTYDALPLGGFSRRAPDPGTDRVRALIQAGALRYVLLNPAWVNARVSNPDVARTRTWVEGNCIPVLSGKFHSQSRARLTLYDCRPAREAQPTSATRRFRAPRI